MVDFPQGFQLLDLHHILYMDVCTSILYKSLYPNYFPTGSQYYHILIYSVTLTLGPSHMDVCMYVCR